MSLSLNEDQEKIVRAKEALDAEREAMKGDTRTLANLRSEHARLKEDFRSLFTGKGTGLQYKLALSFIMFFFYLQPATR